MLLLIDAGNTRIKWALATDASNDHAPDIGRPDDAGQPVGKRDRARIIAADAGRWIASGAVLHDAVESLAGAWGKAPVNAVVIANVAGATVRAALLRQLEFLQLRRRAASDSAQDAAPLVHWFASAAQVAGVRNGYRAPERLGCDRLAALIGARALLPDQAVIVAVCGTATTVDALTASGDFIGGMILPGPGLMASSLARHTAQLPAIVAMTAGPGQAAQSITCLTPFCDNTDDAIASGCLAAQAGAIERAVAAHGGAHCLLSGGAAYLVAPRLGVAVTSVDNLVLIGLQVVASAVTQRAQVEPK